MKDESVIGERPVRATFLPFHRPMLGREEEQEVLDTLRSGWITTGPKTRRFEKDFARYVGAKHAIGVNSCTAALHLSLVAAGIGEDDEVITTPLTFASTVNVIVHQKARPVFVDVEPDTLNIDAARIEEKITPRTKAILPVHFAGQPCDMDSIMDVARRRKLVIIEDAAHAAGAEYRGRKIGSIGDMTCFSFYATKNITTGEGGMLTTDNDELAEKVSILSMQGMSRDAWKRYGESGYRHWDVIYPGYKYNMFDIQAALGLHQLKKIESFWERRREYAAAYDAAFKDTPEAISLVCRGNVKHAHHLYVIMVRSEDLQADRDRVINAIQAENIGIGVHFRAVHLHPYYRSALGFRMGLFPRAEYASDRLLSLPLYPGMKRDDVADVVMAVRKVISGFRK